MKKIVWISFISALVVVNVLAYAADRLGDVYIAMPYRLVVVLGITLISCVFGGAWVLMKRADEEIPSNRDATAAARNREDRSS
ncbi:MAG: hypothetical protein CMQ34_02630 [Gammaproteobacteria bacterium]|nr:hypothetical protein [Gammaproteobacteria bacterium]|tara:strand:+ start:667 stop:915 length:249 start_codon:yes stop_codon:yes gene_type:complete